MKAYGIFLSGTRVLSYTKKMINPTCTIRDMIRHKLDVLGNTLNGAEEVLEAEEVEGKTPDGSTIDVFMEKILQKVHTPVRCLFMNRHSRQEGAQVETFEEREKAYQERRQQQQRDAEVMNQLMQEEVASDPILDGDGDTGSGCSQPTIYFEAAKETLEAAEEELDQLKAMAAAPRKGRSSVARGVTIGKGGKVNRSTTPKKTASVTATPRAAKRKAVTIEGNPTLRHVRPSEADDGHDDFEPSPPKRAPQASLGQEDDDFVWPEDEEAYALPSRSRFARSLYAAHLHDG